MTKAAVPGSVCFFSSSDKSEQGLFPKQDHVIGKSMGFGLWKSVLQSLHSPDAQ